MSAPALTRPFPGSEEVLPAQPDRDTWLAARRAGIGGSDASAVFGLNSFASPIRVWLSKVDEENKEDPTEWPGNAPSEAAHLGNLFESVVRDEWSRRTGIGVSAAGMQRSREHPHMLYSPDGYTDDGGLYEGKTTTLWRRDEWGQEQAPDHAELQVQHGMAVTGLGHAWIAGLIGGQEIVWRRIERDEDMIAELIRFETWWWQSYVVPRVMPPLDDTTATNDVIKELHRYAEPGKAVQITPELIDLFAQRREAKAAVKRAEARDVEVDSLLRVALGGAEFVVADLDAPIDGTAAGKRNVLATFPNNGAFSGSGFEAAYPAIAATLRRTVSVLDTARVKEEHAQEYRAHCARVIRPRKTLDALIDTTTGSK